MKINLRELRIKNNMTIRGLATYPYKNFSKNPYTFTVQVRKPTAPVAGFVTYA